MNAADLAVDQEVVVFEGAGRWGRRRAAARVVKVGRSIVHIRKLGSSLTETYRIESQYHDDAWPQHGCFRTLAQVDGEDRLAVARATLSSCGVRLDPASRFLTLEQEEHLADLMKGWHAEYLAREGAAGGE